MKKGRCLMEDVLTMAVVNFKPSYGEKEQNLNRILGFARAACRSGADVILFPEMSLTGYDFYTDEDVPREEKIRLAETADGECIQKVAEIAQKYGSYIIYGGPEKAEDEDGNTVLYNAAFLTGPEGVIGTYRKIHPFGAENTWCKKGDTPVLLQTPWGPVGIGICYDSYQFPELMRWYTNHAARLYLNPTAEVEEVSKRGSRESFRHYYSLLEAAVRCNYIFIASANLTGYDNQDYFAGGSYIIGPKIDPFFETDVFCYGGSNDNTQETLSMATIDLSLASRALCTPNPVNGETDYREELYKTW